MKRYCIIPARSGSKGLKNKNIKPLNGKPLVCYTIESAINSRLFKLEDIYFTTDSIEYAEIAKKYGISIHMRDASTAGDKSPSSQFIELILSNEINEEDCIFFLLQPTSPLRNERHIQESYELFKDCSSVVSVTKADKSPNLLGQMNDGYISSLNGIDKGYFRQEEGDFYTPNGAIYISTKKHYLNNKSFYNIDTKGYVMDKVSSMDIDNEFDFNLTELMLKMI